MNQPYPVAPQPPQSVQTRRRTGIAKVELNGSSLVVTKGGNVHRLHVLDQAPVKGSPFSTTHANASGAVPMSEETLAELLSDASVCDAIRRFGIRADVVRENFARFGQHELSMQYFMDSEGHPLAMSAEETRDGVVSQYFVGYALSQSAEYVGDLTKKNAIQLDTNPATGEVNARVMSDAEIRKFTGRVTSSDEATQDGMRSLLCSVLAGARTTGAYTMLEHFREMRLFRPTELQSAALQLQQAGIRYTPALV